MGGFDMSDQMKDFYQVDRRSKFYFYLIIFFDFLDLSVMNSKIIYDKMDFTVGMWAMDSNFSLDFNFNYTLTQCLEHFPIGKELPKCSDLQKNLWGEFWHCWSFVWVFLYSWSLTSPFVQENWESYIYSLFVLQYFTVCPERTAYICIYMYICMYTCICNHEIMKTLCPRGYHHSGFVATHTLEHMMCSYILYSSCFCEIWALYMCVYVYIYMCIYIYIYIYISVCRGSCI